MGQRRPAINTYPRLLRRPARPAAHGISIPSCALSIPLPNGRTDGRTEDQRTNGLTHGPMNARTEERAERKKNARTDWWTNELGAYSRAAAARADMMTIATTDAETAFDVLAS